MIRAFRKAMDALYACCAAIACVSLVLISAVIPWGVYTRYVVNRAASWPEPLAILLTIVLTFFGASVCYRANIHMRVAVLSYLLPPRGKRILDLVVEALMGLISLFMVIWGLGLVEATWYQVIAEFPTLSVGVTPRRRPRQRSDPKRPDRLSGRGAVHGHLHRSPGTFGAVRARRADRLRARLGGPGRRLADRPPARGGDAANLERRL
jgi:TRAP-type C4-dicarboxylate transport system permease small subunit